ncbi:MAG: hypothetical protein KGJ86_06095, partial [Chloroflexota bacterium]|nr:hypothetical protein [Chloroflexota bacterium]
MLEGLSGLIARVGQLQHALEGPAGPASSPAQNAVGPASSPARTAAGRASSLAQGDQTQSGAPSFQLALDRARGGPAVALPPIGTADADQMPQVVAGLP